MINIEEESIMSKTVNLIKGLAYQLELNEGNVGKNSRGRKGQLVKQLRDNCNTFFKEEKHFEEDFRALMDSKLISPYFSNNLFPAEFAEYGKYENIIEFSGDMKYELRWMIYCCAYYSEYINFFVNKREQYDNYVLLNRYEEALKIVDEVEQRLGVSFWSIECKFFLYPKLKKNTKELIDIIPQNLYGVVLNFYELKNRENVTFDEYSYIVSKDMESLKKVVAPEYKAHVEFCCYMSLPMQYNFNKENMLGIIAANRYCSLVDRYLLLIDICNETIVSEEPSLKESIEKYIPILECIQDSNLTALRFIFDTENNRIEKYVLKNRLDKAKSKFINGRLFEARESAKELLQQFPNNTEAINLFIETNVLLGEDAEPFKETNLGDLINCLTSAYKLDENRDESIDFISMITNQCCLSSWSKSILNCVIYRCQAYDEEQKKVVEILSNVQHLDIETVISCIEKERCLRLIEKKLDNKNPYVQFRKNILEKNYKEASKLCQIEQIKDLIFICDEHESVENKAMHLRKMQGNDAIMAIRGLRVFLSELDLDKNLEVALSLSCDLVINNVFASLFIPLKKMVEYIDNGDREIRKNICSCIIYYVYAYYYDVNKKEDLGIICEDFFLFEEIEKPSQMSILNRKYKREHLIFFLKNVCNLKVLASSICSFTNSQERDKERVDICNILCQIDAQNVKDYEKEIRELTQKLMINAELKIIEENRIHVNVEGVKERLISAYKNDFSRYQFYEKARYVKLSEILKNLSDGESIEEYQLVSYVPERILKELVIHIRDAFVSSDEYGLDGYLSLNIRHGTLADELRSPLFKAKLNVKADINNGYIIDEKWIQYSSASDSKIISDAIIKFYHSTEAIISKLKNRYIQIKTEDNHSEGKFDYCLYNEIFMPLVDEAWQSSTFEEFVDKVLDVLWQMTERNLHNIREVIRQEIAKDYDIAFEILKIDVSKIKNKANLRELTQKINEATIDMPNILDKICYWFNRSTESKHNDFDLEFVFRMGLETIKNMHPEKEFVVKALEKTDSDKFPGRYLKSFESIFYNLFDNIYKKGMEENGKIVIGYKLKFKNGEVKIYLENAFDCSKNIDEDKEKVEVAKRLIETEKYLKRVKGEGGTGIPKIVKIIRYDLGYNPVVDFGYLEDENKFFMSIEFSRGKYRCCVS